VDDALPHSRIAGLLLCLMCPVVVLVTGCAADRHAPVRTGGDAASTVTRLGAVPIPTAAGSPGPLPASPGHPQLLPIGGAILARLPDGTVTVTALGPDINLPPDTQLPVEDADATITVRAQDTVGNVVPRPAEFTARDDHGRDVPLAGVTATGQVVGPDTATLRLTGHFHAGSAQITWRHDGSVIGMWDFVIELD
jgi:hypothetical protein